MVNESEYTFYVNEKEWMSKDRKTRKKSITKRASEPAFFQLNEKIKRSAIHLMFNCLASEQEAKGKAPTIDKRYLNKINSKHDVYAAAVIVRDPIAMLRSTTLANMVDFDKTI